MTEHRYTPDRYMYREGMKLAERLEAEEKAAAAAGQDPANPPSPIQQVRLVLIFTKRRDMSTVPDILHVLQECDYDRVVIYGQLSCAPDCV